MSGYESDDDFYVEESSSGGNLRQRLEEAIGKINDLTNKVNTLENEKAATSALKEKGIDPALSDLIINPPKNPVEWAERYATLTAKKAPEVPAAEGEEGSEEVPDVVVAEQDPVVQAQLLQEEAALNAMRQAQESGSKAVPVGDLMEQLNKADSEAALMNLIRGDGGMQVG